jgi:hypothetical protein
MCQRDLVVSGQTYEKIFSRLRKEMVPGETKHLIVLLGIPIAYPRLVWLENLYLLYSGTSSELYSRIMGRLTSRIMDPIKALGRIGILGGFINNFDGELSHHIRVLSSTYAVHIGGVELLDDLDDHWTAKSHKSERNWVCRPSLKRVLPI